MFYTERETGDVYEVRFIDSFALVRRATTLYYSQLSKLSLSEFSNVFEPFQGDHEEARAFLQGDIDPDLMITVH